MHNMILRPLCQKITKFKCSDGTKEPSTIKAKFRRVAQANKWASQLSAEQKLAGNIRIQMRNGIAADNLILVSKNCFVLTSFSSQKKFDLYNLAEGMTLQPREYCV